MAHLTLQSFPQFAHKGLAFQFYQDNITAIAYLRQGGGPVEELALQARQIIELAVEKGVDILSPYYLRGKENYQADFGSRNFELEDYMLEPGTFAKINKKWGPLSIDRFADEANALLADFSSRWACPGSAGVDAFLSHWGQPVCNNYLFPPVSLLPQVVDKLLADQARGVLIVPRLVTEERWRKLEWVVVEEQVLNPRRDFRVGPSGRPLPFNESETQWLAILFNAMKI